MYNVYSRIIFCSPLRKTKTEGVESVAKGLYLVEGQISGNSTLMDTQKATPE